MVRRPATAGAVLSLAIGVAACGAVTPTPSMPASSDPTPATPEPSGAVSASRSASPGLPATRQPAGALGREVEIGTIDSGWTEPTLEFASDGESILFSSGVAIGPDAPVAPDLWRYRPGADAPDLVWRNPNRDHSLVRIGGQFGTAAFVDMPVDGERAWHLWLIPELSDGPILLDSHPGDGSVPDFVPSFAVLHDRIAWTAFDLGSDGHAVSQLWYAAAPEWEPRVLVERDPAVAELWLPSVRDTQVAFVEVVYSADQSSDERRVHVIDVGRPDLAPRRLDSSGRATMPVLLWNGGVVWKEAEPGFHMLNWGTMFRYDEENGTVAPMSMHPQEFVNYPSAGDRFVAAWGADSRALGVWDADLRAARLIDRMPPETNVHLLRPHVNAGLLVWMEAVIGGTSPPDPQLRYAFLPAAGSDRPRE